jgi:two-component system, LytTR family, response regulator
MITCMVIDDEPYARQLLSEFIGKVPGFLLEGAYANALNSLPVLSKKSIDVIFLDIQMPDISGIDFLKTLDKRPQIIFTTAFAEHALEGFELDAVDYLLKPFDFNRFLKAINKVTQRIEKQTPVVINTEKSAAQADFMFVKDGNKLVKINYDSILFIKGTREYVTIYTKEKKIMSLQTLRQLEVELPSDFIRVHNSFIIYLPAVGSITKSELEIQGELVPIGITYKKTLMERIKNYEPGKE